ncbi:MAG: hypothetical protein JXB26_13815 [Candidatus Aminicenantes bacterium]|nr:hypothetical protein [Candidatus Aminicenantes bacterium]
MILFSRPFLFRLVSAFFLLTFCSVLCLPLKQQSMEKTFSLSESLKKTALSIRTEVEELGRYADEDFFRREFHMDLDGDELNSEEHVVVMCYDVLFHKEMLIQVTYFSARKDSPVKTSKNTRKIEFILKENDISLKETGFPPDELPALLEKILEGIKSKKELLKLIKKTMKI